MFVEETLQPIGLSPKRQYEEPEGEFLELVEVGNRTITVLTRVEEPTEQLFDPADYSVSELKEKLESEPWTESEIGLILESELENKQRKTAISAIQNHK